jgi:hypothetical protein
VPDFILEDVWALPVEGAADDFPRLLELLASLDPAHSDSAATRFLWQLRDRLGAWFDLGRISVPAHSDASAHKEALAIPDTAETSLSGRLRRTCGAPARTPT